MSSTDDPSSGQSGPDGEPGRRIQTQLVEALMHILIEKGVLTKNDALSVVQTVAHVKLGEAADSQGNGVQRRAELEMLERMYTSFQAVADRGFALADGANVHRLRRPLHDDRPEFPRDD